MKKIMIWIVSLIWVAVVISVVRLLPPLAAWIVGVAGIIGSLFWLIYFVLAPNNIFFTFIKEGTAKVILKAGQFHKVLIQWEDKTLDGGGNVIPGRERHLFGGLRYCGLWPLYAIHEYKFQWTGVKDNGEFEPHPPEILNYILLMDDIYGFEVPSGEDKDLVPLDVGLTLTVRVVNPYKALFAIQNWYETMVNRIRPYVRDFLTTDTYEKLIKDTTRIDRGIWSRLTDEGILDEFKDNYGVEIKKIEVKDINPREEYREATMKAWLGEREAERQANEWVGMVLHSMAKSRGQSLRTIQREIQRDPALQKEFRHYAQQLNADLEKANMGAFFEFRAPDAKGIDASLLSFLALLSRGVPGKNSGVQGGKPVDGERPNKSEGMTHDQKKDFLRREAGVALS